jgi:hypothetical protein
MLAETAAVDAAEDTAFGPDRRGDELPAPLRRQGERLARLREGKRQLDAEAAAAQADQDAKIDAWQQRVAPGPSVPAAGRIRAPAPPPATGSHPAATPPTPTPG